MPIVSDGEELSCSRVAVTTIPRAFPENGCCTMLTQSCKTAIVTKSDISSLSLDAKIAMFEMMVAGSIKTHVRSEISVEIVASTNAACRWIDGHFPASAVSHCSKQTGRESHRPSGGKVKEFLKEAFVMLFILAVTALWTTCAISTLSWIVNPDQSREPRSTQPSPLEDGGSLETQKTTL